MLKTQASKVETLCLKASKPVIDMKTIYFTCILFVHLAACGRNIKNDDSKFIHYVLEDLSKGKAITQLEASDPDWCIVTDSNYCSMELISALQHRGSPQYKEPNIKEILNSAEFDLIIKQMRRVTKFDKQFIPDNVKLIGQNEILKKTGTNYRTSPIIQFQHRLFQKTRIMRSFMFQKIVE